MALFCVCISIALSTYGYEQCQGQTILLWLGGVFAGVSFVLESRPYERK